MTIVSAVDGEAIPSSVIEVGHTLATAFGETLEVVHVLPEALIDQQARSAEGVGGSHMYPPPQLDQSGAGADTPREPQHVDPGGIARRVAEETLEDTEAVGFRGRVGSPAEEVVKAGDEEFMPVSIPFLPGLFETDHVPIELLCRLDIGDPDRRMQHLHDSPKHRSATVK